MCIVLRVELTWLQLPDSMQVEEADSLTYVCLEAVAAEDILASYPALFPF